MTSPVRRSASLEDLIGGLRNHELWRALAALDIKHRYRRSTLGPFWITLSLAVMVGGMGPLYGGLFGVDLGKFLPHLTAGLLFWMFIAGQVTDYADAFISSAGHLRQASLPLSVFIWRVYARHVLIFAHNAIVLVVVLVIWGGTELLSTMLLFVPGFLLVSVNLLALGMGLAIFCARFRDMTPVIGNLITVLFFISPIVWSEQQLPESRRIFIWLNPLAHWLEVLRAPFLGQVPSGYSVAFTVGSALVLMSLSWIGLQRYRHRVTYWL